MVIIHVPSGEVRALAGSPDYAEPVSGQVNCAVSPRSPGSALKPFIYGLAFDRGLCTPETVLADVPVAWSDYRPENFDGRFRGPVTVRAALTDSLNVPAVGMAKRLGVPELLQLFRQVGLSTLDKPAGHYGLGIAIGDGGVTLLDLTNAYAGLARGGLFFPCRLTATDERSVGKRLLSPGAAWMITDILRNKSRPASTDNIPTAGSCPEFVWKTGTSNGYRDAWAIGYTLEYAVGIWIGNPAGTPARDLTGSTMAAPLLKDIFRRLYPKGNSPPFRRPEEVKTRTVCALTGLPPTRNCPGTVEGEYISGISPSGFCAVHRKVKVHDGSPGKEYRIGEEWPPEIAVFMEEQKKGEWNVKTEQEKTGGVTRHGTPLKITAPLTGETFRRMDTGLTGQNRIAVSASGGAGKIYWFENGIYLGTSSSGECLFREIGKRGELRIACIDEEGHGDRVKIAVE
ncbi:MAG: penicillin-binding transpeptidase domain-containing protein [PVC group bacterium]